MSGSYQAARPTSSNKENYSHDKIAVFGAGTWGIALARLLAVHGKDVTVWSAIPAELKALSTTHRHPNLPGMELPATMHYTADIAEACAGRDVLLFAVPSPFVRATAKSCAAHSRWPADRGCGQGR